MIDLDKLRARGGAIRLQGREYVTHSGLLWLAHDHGIESIETDLISWDRADRAAVVKATAIGSRGRFTGYGDADPSNVGRAIAGACLRMAETRAVNRALRLYTGLGMTSAEELPGGATRRAAADAPAPRQPSAPAPPSAESEALLWLIEAAAALDTTPPRVEAALAAASRDYRTIPESKRGAAVEWLRGRLEDK